MKEGVSSPSSTSGVVTLELDIFVWLFDEEPDEGDEEPLLLALEPTRRWKVGPLSFARFEVGWRLSLADGSSSDSSSEASGDERSSRPLGYADHESMT